METWIVNQRINVSKKYIPGLWGQDNLQSKLSISNTNRRHSPRQWGALDKKDASKLVAHIIVSTFRSMPLLPIRPSSVILLAGAKWTSTFDILIASVQTSVVDSQHWIGVDPGISVGELYCPLLWKKSERKKENKKFKMCAYCRASLCPNCSVLGLIISIAHL